MDSSHSWWSDFFQEVVCVLVFDLVQELKIPLNGTLLYHVSNSSYCNYAKTPRLYLFLPSFFPFSKNFFHPFVFLPPNFTLLYFPHPSFFIFPFFSIIHWDSKFYSDKNAYLNMYTGLSIRENWFMYNHSHY